MEISSLFLTASRTRSSTVGSVGRRPRVTTLQEVVPIIAEEAERLVERLVRQGSFDAMSDCARHLPVTIVSKLVGLPEEGRANGNQTIPSGSRFLLLYASANRDERKWADPERFDVTRDSREHLGFGFGAHVCVGMHLARLEITALVKAFARHVTRFELGEPTRAINNVLRGFERLPLTVH